MHLQIYTMRRTIFEGEVSRVSLPTVDGEVTVMEHHEPYVTILELGEIRYAVIDEDASGGKREREEKFPIKGGFLEVREGNSLRVLADE